MQRSIQHREHIQASATAQSLLLRLVGKVLFVVFSAIFFSNKVPAQVVTGGTLRITGTFINTGSISVNNHIINATTGPVSVLPGTVTSRIRMTGGVNAVGHYIYGGGPISFYRLDLDGGREARLEVNVEVTNRLQIGYGTTYTAADSGFTIKSHTLTIDSLATYGATSTANVIFAGGTVLYKGAVSQATLNKANGVRYGTLSFSGAGAKSIAATTSGLDTAATLTQTAGSGQLSITENLDVTGTATLDNVGAISASKKLRFTASVTSGTITSMNNSSTGTLENASNATVTIATLAGNTGTINQSGTSGTITFTNAAASNGTISNTSTGTITFTNNLTGTGTVSQTANGTMNVGGSFTQNTYTLTGGTVVYNGTAAQSVINTTYNNLTISTTGGNAVASGILTLTGNLNISNGSTLDMGSYSTSSFPGTNDNAGAIRWSGDNVYVRSAGTTGTTEFYSSTAGNVAAGTSYRDILFTGTNKTMNNAITATGNITINSGAAVTVGGVTIQINGNLSNSGGLTNNGTMNVGN